MKAEKLYEAIGEVDEKYVAEAEKSMQKRKKVNYKVWGMLAACLCVAVLGTTLVGRWAAKPKPESVQVPNPLVEVASAAEMEKYLDFSVPVLDKAVASYIVIVEDSYPTYGRVEYADGSTFNVKYGREDVSGIYGGVPEKEATIGRAKVQFFTYTDMEGQTIRYATWRQGGFSYSLSGAENLEQEIAQLVK